MTKNTPSVQKDKSWRTVATMLVANAVVLTVLAFFIGQLVRFPCATPPASTWSVTTLLFFCCHVICRCLYELIEDHVEIGDALMPLRREVTACFNDDELRTLCFDLDVEYENLGGTGKAGKVRELIKYLYLLGMILRLKDYCVKVRPHVDWETLVEPSTTQVSAADMGSTRDEPAISLYYAVHPRPEILPNLWLGTLTIASFVIVAVLAVNPPWALRPNEPVPSIESFSVHPGPSTSRDGDAIEVFEGDQVEIEAILRGSASTLCTWFAEKGTRHPAEGCATLYSAPFGETSDVLNVKVQSLCKTREAYSGLSVIVKTR